jgi:hypothetical protein
MAKIVPLISSGVAGPLGVLHLPRLWLKVSLKARGKLDDEYPDIGGGFDTMVIRGLGLTPEAVREFISTKHPTYPEFEAWVAKEPGVKLDKASVHKLNLSLHGYIHDDDTRKEVLGECGLPDDGSVLPDATDLNNLDDWYRFHKAELK